MLQMGRVRKDIAMTLENMLESGLPVNWTTVWVGWRGVGGHRRLVSTEAAIDMASRLVALSPETVPETVISLAGAFPHQHNDVEDLLQRLSAMEGTDEQTEVRKWRWLMLRDLLDALPSEPLMGLLDLGEFWSDFGFPEDSPHIVQGVGNLMTPYDYYTRPNYWFLVERHRTWLDRERDTLLATPDELRQPDSALRRTRE